MQIARTLTSQVTADQCTPRTQAALSSILSQYSDTTPPSKALSSYIQGVHHTACRSPPHPDSPALGAWGGELEIIIASAIFNVDIRVLDSSCHTTKIYRANEARAIWDCPTGPSPHSQQRILTIARVTGNHFVPYTPIPPNLSVLNTLTPADLSPEDNPSPPSPPRVSPPLTPPSHSPPYERINSFNCTHPFVEIRKSTILGLPVGSDLGVFSTSYITPLTNIGTYTGTLLSYRDYHDLYPQDDCRYSFPAGLCPDHSSADNCSLCATCPHKHYYLDASVSQTESFTRYINDCGPNGTPNVEASLNGSEISFRACIPFIPPGAELFYDYGDRFPWQGSRRCPPSPPLSPSPSTHSSPCSRSDSPSDDSDWSPTPKRGSKRKTKHSTKPFRKRRAPPASRLPRPPSRHHKRTITPRKIPVNIIEPVLNLEGTGYTWPHLYVHDPTPLKGRGLSSSTSLRGGAFFPHIGSALSAPALLSRRQNLNDLLTDLQTEPEPISSDRVSPIISSLSHVMHFGTSNHTLTPSIDGHPSILPFRHVGYYGLAITMLANEPSSSEPNCALTTYGLLILCDIPEGTPLQCHYNTSYESLRALQGYSITSNPFISSEHTTTYSGPTRFDIPPARHIAAVIDKWISGHVLSIHLSSMYLRGGERSR